MIAFVVGTEMHRFGMQTPSSASDFEFQDELAKRLVESLRIHVDLPYTECLKSAEVVLSEIIEYWSNHGDGQDGNWLAVLRDRITPKQSSLTKNEARSSFDFHSAAEICEYLQRYRNSSDNREHLWPGGSYPRDGADTSSFSPASAVANLSQIFKKANPRIIFEVIEFPGEGHPEEFRLLDLLTEELKWILQDMENSHSFVPEIQLENICDIVLRSISIHPSAGGKLCTDNTIFSVLPVILQKLLQNGSVNEIAQKWTRLATVVISTVFSKIENCDEAAEYLDFLEHWKSAAISVMDQWDPEVGRVNAAEFPSEQYIALVISVIVVDKRLRRLADISDILNSYFASKSVSSRNALLKLLVDTVINWWNHGTGSVIDGSNLEQDFGLYNAGKLVPEFIRELLPIYYRIPDSSDNFDGTEFHCPAKNEDIEADSFRVISASESVHISEICSRILGDFDPTEDVYLQAASLYEIIHKCAET